MIIRKILFATDYSPASQHALQFATAIARGKGVVLIIAHVVETEEYPVGELFGEMPPNNQPELDRLNSVVPDDTSVNCEYRLLYGRAGSAKTTKPADVILRCAQEERVDAIVVGTHGHSGFRDLLMGSVAETIVRNARCPVVTIRQGKHANLTTEPQDHEQGASEECEAPGSPMQISRLGQA